jgi:hypothetical protein
MQGNLVVAIVPTILFLALAIGVWFATRSRRFLIWSMGGVDRRRRLRPHIRIENLERISASGDAGRSEARDSVRSQTDDRGRHEASHAGEIDTDDVRGSGADDEGRSDATDVRRGEAQPKPKRKTENRKGRKAGENRESQSRAAIKEEPI